MINYTSNEITFLYPGKLNDDELTELGFNPNTASPLTVSDNSVFTVPVQLKNDRYTVNRDMEVDTGAQNTVILHHDSDQLHLESGEKTALGTMTQGVIKANAITVPSFDIGRTPILNAKIVRLDNDASGYKPALGDVILSNCRILLDFPALKMYVSASTNSSPGTDVQSTH